MKTNSFLGINVEKRHQRQYTFRPSEEMRVWIQKKVEEEKETKPHRVIVRILEEVMKKELTMNSIKRPY